MASHSPCSTGTRARGRARCCARGLPTPSARRAREHRGAREAGAGRRRLRRLARRSGPGSWTPSRRLMRTARGDSTLTAPEVGSLADRSQAWSANARRRPVRHPRRRRGVLPLPRVRGPGRERSSAEFPDAVRRPGLRASFLCRPARGRPGKLDRFKSAIPNLFGNYLRLEHLDRDAGSARSSALWSATTSSSRPRRVSDRARAARGRARRGAAGRVELGQAGRGVVEGTTVDDRIETPFLQLVMRRLWEARRSTGSRRSARHARGARGSGADRSRPSRRALSSSLTGDRGYRSCRLQPPRHSLGSEDRTRGGRISRAMRTCPRTISSPCWQR